jgi:hypothetical protein
MTPKAQRIAIAEACPRLFRVLDTPNATIVRLSDQSIVDPLNDLNAMHEVEKRIMEVARFGNELAKIVLGYTGTEASIDLNYWALQRVAHATAAQRAEAFLRVTGRWKDEL